MKTEDALWQSLVEGNRAYVEGRVSFDTVHDLRFHSVGQQNPPVTVLSCSDSRVPPELIFNRLLDQLFVIRVAGNIAAPFELASIEFAIINGYTELIVVLGHEGCGAVQAALSPNEPSTPSLVALVQRIRESFNGFDATLRQAVEMNARSSAGYLVAHSAVIRDAVQSGKVGLAVAYYNLSTGLVERIASLTNATAPV